ncbi:MAG: hypothetical protein ACYC66_04985 [Chloroflexota bacterium]
MILVLITNLVVGLGLFALGINMFRRPEGVWVGVHVVRTPEDAARVRRSNRRVAPWLLFFGLADALSAPLGMLAGIEPMPLALAGLGLLILAIAAQLLVAALTS